MLTTTTTTNNHNNNRNSIPSSTSLSTPSTLSNGIHRYHIQQLLTLTKDTRVIVMGTVLSIKKQETFLSFMISDMTQSAEVTMYDRREYYECIPQSQMPTVGTTIEVYGKATKKYLKNQQQTLIKVYMDRYRLIKDFSEQLRLYQKYIELRKQRYENITLYQNQYILKTRQKKKIRDLNDTQELEIREVIFCYFHGLFSNNRDLLSLKISPIVILKHRLCKEWIEKNGFDEKYVLKAIRNGMEMIEGCEIIERKDKIVGFSDNMKTVKKVVFDSVVSIKDKGQQLQKSKDEYFENQMKNSLTNIEVIQQKPQQQQEQQQQNQEEIIHKYQNPTFGAKNDDNDKDKDKEQSTMCTNKQSKKGRKINGSNCDIDDHRVLKRIDPTVNGTAVDADQKIEIDKSSENNPELLSIQRKEKIEDGSQSEFEFESLQKNGLVIEEQLEDSLLLQQLSVLRPREFSGMGEKKQDNQNQPNEKQRIEEEQQREGLQQGRRLLEKSEGLNEKIRKQASQEQLQRKEEETDQNDNLGGDCKGVKQNESKQQARHQERVIVGSKVKEEEIDKEHSQKINPPESVKETNQSSNAQNQNQPSISISIPDVPQFQTQSHSPPKTAQKPHPQPRSILKQSQPPQQPQPQPPQQLTKTSNQTIFIFKRSIYDQFKHHIREHLTQRAKEYDDKPSKLSSNGANNHNQQTFINRDKIMGGSLWTTTNYLLRMFYKDVDCKNGADCDKLFDYRFTQKLLQEMIEDGEVYKTSDKRLFLSRV